MKTLKQALIENLKAMLDDPNLSQEAIDLIKRLLAQLLASK